MNKKIVFTILFVSILVIAGGETSAVVLVNPLVGVNNICQLLTRIINAVAGIVGAISVIMIIVSGIMYLLSAGSPERINKAKAALVYAIIGMAIAISATGIVAAIKGVINAGGGGCQ
ncbi:MAG: hypothetical protein HY005_03330 [Candidatus Staskawiczbacteria bacterium]|nr:hypothetical protein [Candidatus Staskawiczbacteria bacterium]MBI3337621.1 hypothetical protein [Candidatus Staskawiczbacteria bacterium]